MKALLIAILLMPLPALAGEAFDTGRMVGYFSACGLIPKPAEFYASRIERHSGPEAAREFRSGAKSASVIYNWDNFHTLCAELAEARKEDIARLNSLQ